VNVEKGDLRTSRQ